MNRAIEGAPRAFEGKIAIVPADRFRSHAVAVSYTSSRRIFAPDRGGGLLQRAQRYGIVLRIDEPVEGSATGV